MVSMDMGKFAVANDFSQPLAAKTSVVITLQVLQANDSKHAAVIAHGPGVKFAGRRFLQGLLNGHLSVQYLRGLAHRMNHLPLPFLPPRFNAGQWDAILLVQYFVDRLLLES